MTNTNAATDPASRSGGSRSASIPGKAEATSGATPVDLVPTRLSADRDALILVDAEGTEYAVALGARLSDVLQRAARSETREPASAGSGTTGPVDRTTPPPAPHRTGPATPGHQQTATRPGGHRDTDPADTKGRRVESALRPRDIQHRIRSGEDPESVAAVAGLPVERIMGYAAPVLAERQHIAGSAAKASVRRRSGEPSSAARTLEGATAERMSQIGLDPEQAIAWDAWRRPDGRWTLVADYDHDGARRATFVLDVPGRFVTAEDDEARWLVGDGRFASADRTEGSALGDDALAMVHPAGTATAPSSVPGADTADADWMTSEPEAPRRPVRPAPPAPVVTVDTDDQALPLDMPEPTRPAPVEAVPAHEAEPETEQETAVSAVEEPQTDEPEEPPAPQRPAKNKRGRASVPSWDEIMFGGGKQE